MLTDIISATLRIATPITLAAIGGLLCLKAGVFNIGLEGLMLTGSFAGVAGIIMSGGNVYIGFLVAAVAGMAMSAVFAVASIRFHANQIIVSIAINLLGLGLTSFLLRAMFSTSGSLRPEQINKLADIEIPILSRIIGKQSIVTYFAIAVVLAAYFVLRKTHLGLKIQSVGESPETAVTSGIKTWQIKTAVILCSGALCGLAGAHLSTVVVSEFTENMVAGRGFTAFTAVAFSSSNPIVTFLVTLLLGFADAVGIRLELLNLGVSPSVVKMFPYVLALMVYTCGTAVKRARLKKGASV